MSDFYDWQKTLSYDADVTMVVGTRGVGKTFGLRTQFIRDWKKDGSRFVEVCRYKNELFGVSDGYFNRVGDQAEFKDLMFKTDSRHAYVAYKDAKTDTDKPEWEIIGYFAALSDAQRLKKRTFDHVRRIVLDEAIIDRRDRYHNYLPSEFTVLANLVDTVSRERKDTKSVRPRVYLLGNALSFANPYFARYGVTSDLSYGYRWFNNKTFLLHYVHTPEYSEEKQTGTVAGRMLAGTAEGNSIANNTFMLDSNEFVARKPSRAKFTFGIVYNGNEYGIWADMREGRYYVSKKIPKNTLRPIYSLSREDASVNYMAVTRASTVMQSLENMWYLGLISYESVDLKMQFADVLAMFGIR